MEYLNSNLEEKIIKIFNTDNIYEKLEKILTTNDEDKSYNAEHSTPFKLIHKIISKANNNIWNKNYKFLDYCCGKGFIILSIFNKLYNTIKIDNKLDKCRHIIENCIYFADINESNIRTTIFLLNSQANILSGTKYKYKFNYYIGDSFNLDLNKIWGIDKVNIIFVNPPFENKLKRNKTPHKLWIDFTKRALNDWLIENGTLLQISPSSFSSPSSKILKLLKEKHTTDIFFNQEEYFPDIASSISWYIIENKESKNLTNINDKLNINLSNFLYLPQNICTESLSIHKKVVFDTINKLDIHKDYVTCHNALLKKNNSPLSKIKTQTHIYPVFHTNKQTWYSSILQPFAHKKKVLWTRSGYQKPFYSSETLGVTDLSYFILVDNDNEGKYYEKYLNSELLQYIFKSAKWSGFGNDKVFYALPDVINKNLNESLTDIDIYKLFNITHDEIEFIKNQ